MHLGFGLRLDALRSGGSTLSLADLGNLRTDLATNGVTPEATLKVWGVDDTPANVTVNATNITLSGSFDGDLIGWDFGARVLIASAGAQIGEIRDCLWTHLGFDSTVFYMIDLATTATVGSITRCTFDVIPGNTKLDSVVFQRGTSAQWAEIGLIERCRFLNLPKDCLRMVQGTVRLCYFSPPRHGPAGATVYDGGATYNTGDAVLEANGALFFSKIDSNTGNALPDPGEENTQWFGFAPHTDGVTSVSSYGAGLLIESNLFDNDVDPPETAPGLRAGVVSAFTGSGLNNAIRISRDVNTTAFGPVTIRNNAVYRATDDANNSFAIQVDDGEGPIFTGPIVFRDNFFSANVNDEYFHPSTDGLVDTWSNNRDYHTGDLITAPELRVNEISLDAFTLTYDDALPVFSARRQMNTGWVPVSGVGTPDEPIEGRVVGGEGDSSWVDVVDEAGSPVQCDSEDGTFFGYISGGQRSDETYKAQVRLTNFPTITAETANSCYIGTHIIQAGQSEHRYLTTESDSGGTPAVTASTDNRVRFNLIDHAETGLDIDDVQTFDVAGTSTLLRAPMWNAANLFMTAIPKGPIVVTSWVRNGASDFGIVDDDNEDFDWDNIVLVTQASHPHVVDRTRPVVVDLANWGFTSAADYGANQLQLVGPQLFGLLADGTPVTRGATVTVGSDSVDCDHFWTDLIDFDNGAKASFMEGGGRTVWDSLQDFNGHPVYGDFCATSRPASIWHFRKGEPGTPWTDVSHSSRNLADGANRQALSWASCLLWEMGFVDPAPIKLDWIFGFNADDVSDEDFDARYVWVGIDGRDVTTLRWERDPEETPGSYGHVIDFFINGTMSEDVEIVTFKGQQRFRLQKPALADWDSSDAILYQPNQEFGLNNPADAIRASAFELDHAGVAVTGALSALEVYPLDYEEQTALFTNQLSSFEPRSASFSGSQYVGANGLGVDGGPAGVLSQWIYFDGTWNTPGSTRFFQVRNSSFSSIFEMRSRSGGGIEMLMAGVSTTSLFPSLSAGNWYHILWSWKVGAGGWNQVYINNAVQSGMPDLTSATISINASGAVSQVYNPGVNVPLAGDVAHTWFDPDYELDLSVTANREKFALAGVPVDLGANGELVTGSAPPFYYDGVGSGWNNLGTVGALTVTNGPLTAGGTPSY